MLNRAPAFRNEVLLIHLESTRATATTQPDRQSSATPAGGETGLQLCRPLCSFWPL
jgi:hypothetical protein